MRALLAALLAASLTALGGCASPPAPRAEFALMGDTPYTEAQARRLDREIERINTVPLAFVVHVGDIIAGHGRCDDAWFAARARQFARFAHPFILLPGDNDWTDCHRGGFDPLERLAAWRQRFCTDPVGLPLERQSRSDARFVPYCEHLRWRLADVLFVGVNVPGSNNNLGRTREMDTEHTERMAAVAAWLRDSYALAARTGIQRVVVLMQANPGFAGNEGAPFGAADGYASLRELLTEGVATLRRDLTVVTGDTHTFRRDDPMPGVDRIEVPGAPFVAWLRVSIGADGGLRVE